jgi:hypothetical protein
MWFVGLFVLIAALAVMAVAPAKADASTGTTSYSYTSEPGDYIGRGEQNLYRASDSSISVQGTSAYLTVVVERGGERWSVDLAAPRGETLHPGRYYDAERASFRTGRAPGLDVSGNGRGCNEVWGTFSIRQISTDSSGRVTMLEATFVQNCESSLAAGSEGHGQIPRQTPLLRLHERPGRLHRRRGIEVVLRRHLDVLTGWRQNHRGLQRLRPAGRLGRGHQGPTGKSLQPGTYNTTRFGGTGTAGLDVSGDGRGCNTSTGKLTIRKITFDAAGKVARLDASFVQHCEGAAPVLHGRIRHYA